MIIILKSLRKEGETVEELINRALNTKSIMTTLLNSAPHLNNAGAVREIITKESFKQNF